MSTSTRKTSTNASTNTSTNASTNTSTSGPSTGVEDSTVRPGLKVGRCNVDVRFGVWGPQEVSVHASSGGGRGGAPYIVVQVGTCLTYAYDQAAVDSYVRAWEAAVRLNHTVLMPEFAPASATQRHAGEDLSVVCNVSTHQRHTITSHTGADGRPVITVNVGAVTVDVHTPPRWGPTLPPGARLPPSPRCWKRACGRTTRRLLNNACRFGPCSCGSGRCVHAGSSA